MEIENIRKNIKQLRKAKGFTQKDMAAKLFIDERTYSKIERGEQKSMDVRFILSVANILEMDPLNILKGAFTATEHTDTQKQTDTTKTIDNCLQQFNDAMSDFVNLKQEFKSIMEQQKQILETLKIYTV